jgi:hypothetical protein
MISVAKEKVLKLSAVARMLNVCAKTVKNWTQGIGTEGGRKLEVIYIGRVAFTSYEALERFALPSKDVNLDTLNPQEQKSKKNKEKTGSTQNKNRKTR